MIINITAMARNKYSNGSMNCFNTRKIKPMEKIIIGKYERWCFIKP